MTTVHRVFATALTLTDFRNHAAFSLSPGRRSVVLLGDNGVGKTNVLEALSLLSPGRGLRRAPFRDLARRNGPGGWAIHARIDGPLGPVGVGTGLKADDGGREIRIDAVGQKSAEALTDHVRVMWLTPAMDGLFTGPAGDRRRFLDRMVLGLDPGHGRRAAALEQALTQRNRLLEDGRSDPAWLDAVEIEIARLGVAVAAARRETVDRLTGLIATTTDADTAFPQARIAVEGTLEAALAGGAAADLEDWYRVDLKAARSRDRAAGRTLVGAHRSDLLVRHGAKDMPAALSSTGEQKALLIGLTLAQARLVAGLSGQTPILLLDEIAAHLDARRRAALFAILSDIGCQTYMTGTDEAPFAELAETAELHRLGA